MTREQPRKPKGSPNGAGGRYDTMGGGPPAPLPDLGTAQPVDRLGLDEDTLDMLLSLPDDASPRARRLALYAWMDEMHGDWLYDETRLMATMPGDDADYRGQPVCSPEEEIRIVSRALGSDESWVSLGPVARRFKPVAASPQDAYRMGQAWIDGALLSERRSCALNPARAYTAAMVQAKMGDVRLEAMMHAGYGWQAHRGRDGGRYQKRLNAHLSQHGGRLTTTDPKDPYYGLSADEVKDRLWDEAMDEWVAYQATIHEDGHLGGGGHYYSDGSNADPTLAVNRRRAEAGLPPERDRTRNGRILFERMRADTFRHIRTGSLDMLRCEHGWEPSGDLSAAARDPGDAADAALVIRMAFDRGLDPYMAGGRLGMSHAQVDMVLRDA